VSGRETFTCKFQDPAPNYYDGKLATMFENCIKDKFEGLQVINEIDSSYVKTALKNGKEARKL
jgi:hypothetical protein